ncbi:YdcF family protein [Apilactobacillus xinyiensis]|uniref:YdcF family protein n=1 Tax=Apilactobacillus xinyiensis TaxID=2841032 RepID=A0ABT0I2L6_9LACO|nr:YdcF family protein [Apilactobacillus xinyiensis]MCK8624975.1 YdcF family protein [Apilactobacillus xinyiensis]MCL0330507.1 YdcF family protein [Apilactobacillus xinyiensis]
MAITVITINNDVLTRISLICFIVIMFPLTIIYTLQWILWLWNAWIVWRKESHSLANMLTLIIGLAILISPIIVNIINNTFNNKISDFIISLIQLSTFYVVFCFAGFISSAVMCLLYRPKKNKDYIIVLGSGLINGNQVSPLLAARINKGINFMQQQIQSGQKAPVLICSGGQGKDETISEGTAMREYALNKGVPENLVMAETKSKNTLQNMQFSKKIIESKNINPNNGIFVSNNYHIYRASGYARISGLNINGIGAKTSYFFIPNAIIREYIAILLGHKKIHLIMGILILIVSIWKTVH